MSDAAPSAAYFLVGPTAVGKSAVSQKLAEQFEAAILSADSMLIYRGMDIGTATPSAAERGTVPYFGVDLVDPCDDFSVWDYRCAALDALKQIPAGQDVIVTGGTGLYIKCLTHGLDNRQGGNPELRARYEQQLLKDGVEGLQDALRHADPVAYAALSDPQNPRRLIRALESVGFDQSKPGWRQITPEPLIVGLAMDPVLLNSRIAQRVSQMYDQGLVQEVEQLLARESPLSRTASQAIGYAEAIALIQGEMTQADAIERTIIRTRRLAKRQRTWFRNQAHVEWVEVTSESTVESVADDVSKLWRTHGPTTIQG